MPSTKTKPVGTIRNFILLNNLVLVFIPMTVFGLLFTQIFTTTLQTEIDRKNTIILDTAVAQINSYLDGAVNLVRQMALVEATRPFKSETDRATYLSHLMALYPVIDSLELLNSAGLVVFNAPTDPASLGLSRAGLEYFRQVRSGQDLYWSPSFISPVNLKATVTLAVKVDDRVLVAFLNLEKITQLATNLGQGLDPSLDISVIDSQGIYISHRDAELVKTRVYSPFFPALRSGLARDLHNFSVVYREELYQVEARQMGQPDWVVQVSQKTADAYRPIDLTRWFFILFQFLWLASAIIFSLVRMRALTLPLAVLEKRTQRVAEGDYSESVGHQKFRELESLASHFDAMVASIKQRDDQLRKQNGELERFTYTVSHDLKSPLITIKGFIGFVEQDVRSGNLDRFDKDIQRINQAAGRMEGLLEDLLELSRLGRVINPATEFSMLAPLRAAIELLDGPIRLHQAELSLALDWPTLRGDELRLREVWQNLLENALKYRHPQRAPRIEFGHYQEAGQTVYFIQDNGIGIPPDYQDKVFGLFEKLDPHSEGTGIGLALVRRIIELHGGKIWIRQSNAPGTGVCFTLPSGAPMLPSYN